MLTQARHGRRAEEGGPIHKEEEKAEETHVTYT